MKQAAFKKKVNNFKNYKNWIDKLRLANRGIKIIKNKAFSVYIRIDVCTSNNYTLLDSTASVHIFHNKKKFFNFKKVRKSQRL